ncbi:9128_t:CDS:1, partial [Scutellospora calospora]
KRHEEKHDAEPITITTNVKKNAILSLTTTTNNNKLFNDAKL